MIEISDTTLNYDLNQKQSIYAAANIPEYWVANIKEKKLIVFTQPNDNDYLTRSELTSGIIKPSSFPNLSLSVTQLFAT